MKISYVLTATNSNEMYSDFIPSFIKAWNTLFPEVKVKIIFIADSIPEKYYEYSNNIILFKPIANVHTAFQAQFIRILYPSILGENEEEKKNSGVLITDMDMIPMNRTYYTKGLEAIPTNKFIAYRNVIQKHKELAICYNLATPKVWNKIFGVADEKDIRKYLSNIYSSVNYSGIPGKNGWATDQLHLYQKINQYQSQTKNVVYLNDRIQGYHRMNRNNRKVTLNDSQKNQIKNGTYSDYHMHRPYKSHKKFIDDVIQCFDCFDVKKNAINLNSKNNLDKSESVNNTNVKKDNKKQVANNANNANNVSLPKVTTRKTLRTNKKMDAFYENVEKKWRTTTNGGWEGIYYGVFSKLINEENFKVCAEVGIGYGFHADEILKNTNIDKLYLIDPCKYYRGDAFPEIIQRNGGFDALFRKINHRLSSHKNRYEWFRKGSLEITNENIADESLDAVFIDGDHRYDAVKKDLSFWWKKVKEGGQMLGDDFWMADVKRAVTEFAQENNLEFDFLYKKNGTDPSYKIYRFKK